MRRRPDIDGLRTLAVLPVLFFHAGLPGFSGGYVGVDIFFVISGFLITSTIAEEIAAGTFTVARFYNRRIRRIFPALAAVVLVTACAGMALMAPDDAAALGASVVSTALFVSNILFWLQSGYFDTGTALKPLLHTWSLSVEEQFYVLFPLLLVGLARLRRDARVAVWLLLLLSLGMSVWQVRQEAGAAFYLLHTRAWELLAGAVLALGAVPRLPSQRWREAAGALGVLLIAAAVVLYGKGTRFPGEAAIPPCLGAALLIHAGREGRATLAARLLSLPPLVFVGLISYSLYLWHWPILVLMSYRAVEPLGPGATALALGLSFGAAVLSWRYVERPVRRAVAAPDRCVILAAAAGTLAVAALGPAIDRVASSPAYVEARYGPRFVEVRRLAAQSSSPDACVGKLMDDLTDEDCILNAAGRPAAVALLGDSFADALAAPLAEALRDDGLPVAPYIWYSCPSILGTTRSEAQDWAPGFVADCRAYVEAAVKEIAADPAIRTVVMSNNYDWYLNRRSTVNGRLMLAADGAPDDLVLNRAALLRQVGETVAVLARAGKRVVVVGTSPTGHDPQGAQGLMRRSLPAGDEALPASACADATAETGAAAAQAFPGRVLYLDLERYFLRGETCAATRDGLPLTTDGSHLAAPVTRDVAARIRAAILTPHP